MPYAITALSDGTVLRQTRVQRASAMVLAQKWIASGFGEVEIVDGGKRYSLEAFHRRFGWKAGRYYDRESGMPVANKA